MHPTLRALSRHVFGAYCSEPWKLSQRYYGTGETFVFQLEPRQVGQQLGGAGAFVGTAERAGGRGRLGCCCDWLQLPFTAPSHAHSQLPPHCLLQYQGA